MKLYEVHYQLGKYVNSVLFQAADDFDARLKAPGLVPVGATILSVKAG